MGKLWHNFHFLMALTIVIWASTGTTATYLLKQGLAPGEMLVYECALAAAVLAVLTVAMPGSRRAVASYGWRHVPAIVVCGLLGIFVYNYLLYAALGSDVEDVVPYVVINYLWPMTTIVFAAWILREKMSGQVIVACVVGFAGFLVIQLAKMEESTSLLGVSARGCLMALGAAVVWGLFSSIARKWSDRYGFEPLSSMTLFVTVGALAGLAVFWRECHPARLLGRWDLLAVLVILGGLAHGLSNILWLQAIKVSGAGRTAVVAYLTPVLALGYLGVFHRQWPEWYSVFGLAMILGATALVQLKKAGRRKLEAALEEEPPTG